MTNLGPKTPEIKKEATESLSLTEKIKREKDEAAAKKKKSMDAWGDTGEKADNPRLRKGCPPEPVLTV